MDITEITNNRRENALRGGSEKRWKTEIKKLVKGKKMLLEEIKNGHNGT